MTMEAFHRSSDYQRDLGEAATDSFLEDFEDCRVKVLLKYSEVDLSSVPSIDTPSMPQAMDSSLIGDVEAFIASSEEDGVVNI